MSKRWMGSTLGLLALALIFGGAAHAAQTAAPKTAAKKAPATHEMTGAGVITSVDGTHLTFTRKVNGKDEPTTVVLAPETKQDGALAAGNKVSVRYRMENNDKVATSVRAQTATAKVKTPGGKAKKS